MSGPRQPPRQPLRSPKERSLDDLSLSPTFSFSLALLPTGCFRPPNHPSKVATVAGDAVVSHAFNLDEQVRVPHARPFSSFPFRMNCTHYFSYIYYVIKCNCIDFGVAGSAWRLVSFSPPNLSIVPAFRSPFPRPPRPSPQPAIELR